MFDIDLNSIWDSVVAVIVEMYALSPPNIFGLEEAEVCQDQGCRVFHKWLSICVENLDCLNLWWKLKDKK